MSYYETLAKIRNALKKRLPPAGMMLMGVPAAEFTKSELLKLIADLIEQNVALKYEAVKRG